MPASMVGRETATASSAHSDSAATENQNQRRRVKQNIETVGRSPEVRWHPFAEIREARTAGVGQDGHDGVKTVDSIRESTIEQPAH